jgi:ligand-binding sensor domain-containing protein
MIKRLFVFLIFSTSLISAQVDYSDSWEDFFSYNNVKDFIKSENIMYALSDNAIFTYDFTTQEIKKLSSVQGLSGETTSAIHYSTQSDRLVIGYKNGLVEVVDSDGSITISADILNFNQTGEKSINDIYEYQGKLYLATSFAIIEYDIDQLEFGDTFFIGNNSTDVKINEIVVFDDFIYAATERGIYTADINNANLIDFNNWNLISSVNNNYTNIIIFNSKIYTTLNKKLYEVTETNEIVLIDDYSSPIVSLKGSSTNLSVVLNSSVSIYSTNFDLVLQNNADINFDYILNTAFAENNQLFLATKQFGILSSLISDDIIFQEIHPEGPVSNDVFSVTAKNNQLWVVYGGYTPTMAPIQPKLGYSHYNGESWFSEENDPDNSFPGFVDVTLDPNNENRAFISSFGSTNQINTYQTGGLFVIENDEITNFYNNLNSPLEDIYETNPSINGVTVRISSSVFDNQGNLWIANIGLSNELKKFSNGSWTEYDISSVKPNSSFGLSEIITDRNNSIWMGTRGDGVIVFNQNGERIRSLTSLPTKGNLPNLRVISLASDSDNRIWIGTISGLVVFSNASGVFDADVVDAQPVIFEEDGIAKKLLGDQYVSAIAVDGANNKWFGTSDGGATYTNPNGQTTIANFSKENSPLPSDRITKISVDKEFGKVFFATDKGIVAYNSNVAPFGETLGEVYAYPNPVRKFHNTVTIDGRNGTNLPKGTNVKILDIAGNLVYETNVIEGQELQGGKVIWDKKNLAGNNVASGIYIVLLANEDASETSSTKIAIIN